MVGAGGLGFELVSSLKLFKYQETATCIVVITVMVVVADLIFQPPARGYSPQRARLIAVFYSRLLCGIFQSSPDRCRARRF